MHCDVIAFVGLPGTGKGTQAKALGALPGFYYFGMGSTLRALDETSEKGRQVRRYMEDGRLLPAPLVISIWQDQMRRARESGDWNGEDVVLLDGLPRDREQAELLDEHATVHQVIHLVAADEEELLRRLRERTKRTNRRDGSEEITRRRFDTYRKKTLPLLQRYPEERIQEVSAIQEPLAVLAAVVAAVQNGDIRTA